MRCEIKKIKSNAFWLRHVEYNEAWKIQKEHFEERKEDNIPDTILFLEHPHTITLGKSSKIENLLLDEKQLIDKNIDLKYIDRGGDITYHGPGQLVVYPILDLKQHFKDVHKYLRVLEEVVIDFLSQYQINSNRIEGLTGVWVGHEKVCAIGVKVSRWITMHGIAININTDLDYFQYIIPCGISDKNVTSLERLLGRKVDLHEAVNRLITSFEKHFNLDINISS